MTCPLPEDRYVLALEVPRRGATPSGRDGDSGAPQTRRWDTSFNASKKFANTDGRKEPTARALSLAGFPARLPFTEPPRKGPVQPSAIRTRKTMRDGRRTDGSQRPISRGANPRLGFRIT